MAIERRRRTIIVRLEEDGVTCANVEVIGREIATDPDNPGREFSEQYGVQTDYADLEADEQAAVDAFIASTDAPVERKRPINEGPAPAER